MRRKKLDNQTHNDLHMPPRQCHLFNFQKIIREELPSRRILLLVAILTISVLKNSEEAVLSRHPRSYGIDSNVGLAAT